MATIWEIVACSVGNLLSLPFVYLLYLLISRFGLKSGISFLIAPVSVHCCSITLIMSALQQSTRLVHAYENEKYKQSL